MSNFFIYQQKYDHRKKFLYFKVFINYSFCYSLFFVFFFFGYYFLFIYAFLSKNLDLSCPFFTKATFLLIFCCFMLQLLFETLLYTLNMNLCQISDTYTSFSWNKTWFICTKCLYIDLLEFIRMKVEGDVLIRCIVSINLFFYIFFVELVYNYLLLFLNLFDVYL